MLLAKETIADQQEFFNKETIPAPTTVASRPAFRENLEPRVLMNLTGSAYGEAFEDRIFVNHR